MKQQINEVRRMQQLAGIIKQEEETTYPINESFNIFNAFALAGALTMGVSWLRAKKAEIAHAEAMSKKHKADKKELNRIQAEKEAAEAAKQALTKAEYQNTLRQIQSDKDIKNWTKEIDTEMEKQWDAWERSGGDRSYGMGYPAPSWGSGKEDLLKKIEDKIKTFERGKELLDLLSKSGKGLGSADINPRG